MPRGAKNLAENMFYVQSNNHLGIETNFLWKYRRVKFILARTITYRPFDILYGCLIKLRLLSGKKAC